MTVASSAFAPGLVGFWHETDMPIALGNVRSWGRSGKHLLALSFSDFDPERTFLDLDQSRTAAFHNCWRRANVKEKLRS